VEALKSAAPPEPEPSDAFVEALALALLEDLTRGQPAGTGEE
jgi:hypothetical protein